MWIFAILLTSMFYNTPVYADNERELVYLQLVTTNGLFTPLHLYPKDENREEDFPEELGQLTQLGKVQHYEFGKVLREFYKDFITSSPTEVDAFSSAEDRSTQSLLCLLASLYAPSEEWEFFPGFHWQPIPVSYLDEKDIFFRYSENCAAQLQERLEQYNSNLWKAVLEHDMFFYAFWEHFSGAKLWTWREVTELYDTVEKEKLFGLKVPHWINQYGYEMKTVANRAYRWSFPSVRSLQLKIGSLIELMTVRMQAKTIEPDDTKVSVYMTHDWNMAALLIATGVFNDIRPPPCATVAIEMYRNTDDEEYSVQMRYFNSTTPELGHQVPHTLIMDTCTEYCPLNVFVDHFKFVIPGDFFALCQGLVETEEELSLYHFNSSYWKVA